MKFSKEVKDKARVIAWDLETSNLNADFGYILSAGWLDLSDRKPHVIRIDSYPGYAKDKTNDRALCKEIAGVLANADIWLTWYGDRFDIPYLNTRLLWHGLGIMPPIPSVDGWRAARNHLKLSSNRLANVTEFLDVQRKSPVVGWQWVKAAAGHRTSLNYVVEHNRKDIIALGEVYDKLRPIIRNHPNVNLVEHNLDRGTASKSTPCPICSSSRVQKRGYRIAKSRRSVRYQCQACGSWFSGPSERPGDKLPFRLGEQRNTVVKKKKKDEARNRRLEGRNK